VDTRYAATITTSRLEELSNCWLLFIVHTSQADSLSQWPEVYYRNDKRSDISN